MELFTKFVDKMLCETSVRTITITCNSLVNSTYGYRGGKDDDKSVLLFNLCIRGGSRPAGWRILRLLCLRHAIACQTPCRYVIVGSLLIIFGVFMVTAIFNIPLNDTLAAATSGSSEGAQTWGEYLDSWVPWNHVRTIASIGALISFICAIRRW